MEADPTRLPPRRRRVAAGMGTVTVVLLAAALWQVGTGRADDTGRMAAATTTTTSVTTAPSTTEAPTTTPPVTAPSTTRPPRTTATTEPTTTTTTLAPLVLEADGLGPVSFGATPEEAVEAVGSRLGPVTSDSGWVAARGRFGTCPGNIVRVMRWQSLRLFFGDGPTEFGEDGRHFFYYNQSPAESDAVIDLTTDTGIGIGSTVEELTAAYGDRVAIESSSEFGVTFVVDGTDSGLLSGTLTESVPEGQVTSVAGGFGCGS